MLSDFYYGDYVAVFYAFTCASYILSWWYTIDFSVHAYTCSFPNIWSRQFLKFNMLSLVSPKFGIMSWLLDLLKMSHEFIYNDIRIGCCTVRLAALPDPTYKGYLAQFEAIMNTPFIWNQTAKDLLTMSVVFVTFWMFFVELCIIFHFFPSCLEYGPAKLDIFQ